MTDTYPAALQLPLINGAGGKNKMEKSVGREKDRGDCLPVTITGETESTGGKPT